MAQSARISRWRHVLGFVLAGSFVGLVVVDLGLLPVHVDVDGMGAAGILLVPVVVAALLGGVRGAVVALGFCAADLAVVLLPPYSSVRIHGPHGAVVFVAFVTLAGLLGGLASRAQRLALRVHSLGPDRRVDLRAGGPAPARFSAPPVRPAVAGPDAGSALDLPRPGTSPAARRLDRTRSRGLRQRPLIVYFGHHKCGTSWIGDILVDVAEEMGWSNWSTDRAAVFPDGDLARWAADNRVDVVTFTNAESRFVPRDGRLRGFHVIRDPRDVCVSAYFSHRNSHPTQGWPLLVDVREFLCRASLEEGLAFEIDFLAPTFEAMASWDYRHPEILEMRFEELVAAPTRTLLSILQFVGLCPPADEARRSTGPPPFHAPGEKVRRRLGVRPSKRLLTPERVATIVYRHTFAAKSGGRQPGQLDAMSHYRSGEIGQWRSYFTPSLITQFEARYPGLLSQLGYTAGTDDSW